MVIQPKSYSLTLDLGLKSEPLFLYPFTKDLFGGDDLAAVSMSLLEIDDEGSLTELLKHNNAPPTPPGVRKVSAGDSTSVEDVLRIMPVRIRSFEEAAALMHEGLNARKSYGMTAGTEEGGSIDDSPRLAARIQVRHLDTGVRY